MSVEEVTRASVGLRSERGPLLMAVMLSISLVAIDATILATAVPAVVDDLGGFTQFPWLFSIYLLAQAVTVPVYSKLADQFGRKPVMLVGIGLFVLGSLLCGFAWSMGALIAFRAVQGLGAGAVTPMSMTIVGDSYSLEERAKVQGYVASVWAVSSVVGPVLGGVLADYASWRWIFLINIPLGMLAAVMIGRHLHEDVERRPHRIDYAGSLLLTGGGILLLLGLLEGGIRWAWSSPTSIALFGSAAVLLVGFWLVERRAAEPVLPLWLLRHRVVVAAMAASSVVGVLMMGLTTYVPLYAQSVLGHGAVLAGLALAAMTLGWPITASTSGRLYLTIGFRATISIGGAVAATGAFLLLLVGPDSPLLLLALPCFVMGLGFGLVASPSLVAAQSSVTWQHRGVATGSTLFARSVGSAVGVAAFGAVVNHQVASRLGRGVPDIAHLTPAVLDPAIEAVFVVAAVTSLALLVVGLLMPKRVEEPVEA